MAKYNKKTVTPTVVNHQGGTGFKLDPKFELIGLLSTGLDGRFYEKESERENRLITLIKEIGRKDPTFVAKALVYTRSVIGQRSVTHVGAVAAAQVLSGNPIASRFFSKRSRNENSGGIVYRMDDMIEIMSYYFLRNPGKPLPNALKRGFKSVLEDADAYELAKYQAKGKDISMVDIVNLVRPKPSKKMEKVFNELMTGKLKQFNTAEDKNSKSGQEVAAKVKSGTISKAEGEKLLSEAKSDNWDQLIGEGTIGYLALLRNLRNIVEQANDLTFDAALLMLTDEKRVRKSLVFPHQIDIAFEVLLLESNVPSGRKIKLLSAINTAYELSIPNLTELFTYGRTAVVFDTSGSMSEIGWDGGVKVNGKNINKKPVEKASLVAATLVKGIGADMYHFASRCEKLNYNPLDSINTIKNVGVNSIGHVGHGTEFDEIFSRLEGKYDRIFIISDMQGGDTITGRSRYKDYVNKYGQPFIYSINICGYGTTMFKESNKVVNIFGYSSDIYEYVKRAEVDPKAILKEIENINI